MDEPTYIPLGRLTMLLGPNSAGNSSVQDAIALYEKLMSKDRAGESAANNERRRAAPKAHSTAVRSTKVLQ